uniref:tRNA-uridine aminocarboxypropyltransferase 1 n=1 Tax=Timema genevievae TaxID=629358 RepID=A0A7R9PN79_TIMGE|nr:unnamed protein product [Timema genevievae]
MNPKHDLLNDYEPFKNLKIDDWTILNDIDQRSLCQVCKKSRKYFCYTCYVPVNELRGRIPNVKVVIHSVCFYFQLPIKIDIIKHCREIDGKSTAAHVALLAPDDVNVYTYPCIPDYDHSERVVLVYPGNGATSLENLCNIFRILGAKIKHVGPCMCRETEPSPKKVHMAQELPISRAVFIDSTWNQSRGIYKDQRLRALPCVVLESRVSQFWRHQKNSPRWYLATVEAVYQLLVELHTATTKDEEYQGQYDNLLFLFHYMYSKIHDLYKHEDLQAYKRPLK